MGYSSYSDSSRTLRATSSGYYTKSMSDVFTQQKSRTCHKDMDPKDVKVRECMDSEAHPNTVPVQFYLDVTGSMGSIPQEMIRDGLPKLIGSLIQNGIPDVSLMFGAVGDHECDSVPLQVAQFESGDAELDMWLTRTFLEGGGGGNAGESYLLAWYFAANHITTDATNKRGKKGYVFTIGDEPTLRKLPINAVKSIMGDTAVGQETFTAEALLEAAQKDNHVFHIHIVHNSASDRVIKDWKNVIGQNLLIINSPSEVAKVISDTILSYESMSTLQGDFQYTPDENRNESKQDQPLEILL